MKKNKSASKAPASKKPQTKPAAAKASVGKTHAAKPASKTAVKTVAKTPDKKSLKAPVKAADKGHAAKAPDKKHAKVHAKELGKDHGKSHKTLPAVKGKEDHSKAKLHAFKKDHDKKKHDNKAEVHRSEPKLEAKSKFEKKPESDAKHKNHPLKKNETDLKHKVDPRGEPKVEPKDLSLEAKALAKKAPAKKTKVVKKDTEELEDDYVDTDDLGESEIAEYEEELQAVEEIDDLDAEDDGADLALGIDDGIDDDEIILTDAEGRRYCRVKDCDQISVVEGYCRFHYLLLWKKIQVRKKILADGKLEKYVEELTSRYPDKFLEMIRKDLKTEKDFSSAIGELEIDESAENEFEEDAQSYIDEVRGIGETTAIEDEEF